MVIWFIGLSGAGKSFFSKKIFNKINKKNKPAVLVDGDEVRKYFNSELGYSKKEREINSIFIRKLCKYLESKRFNVVCSILSIFPKHQKENRKIFKKYIQVYVKSDIKKLIERNNNRVYKKTKKVVGRDIEFPKPYKSDFIIENDFKETHKEILKRIIKKING
tara:strand:+ start:3121 stop:3609 length:489 start_codon:yes stop_codon:yes gene_type:complete